MFDNSNRKECFLITLLCGGFFFFMLVGCKFVVKKDPDPNLISNLFIFKTERVRVASENTPKKAPEVKHCPHQASDSRENKFNVTLKIEPIQQVDPEGMYWCWAACAQMINKYYGKNYSQEEIARRIHGTNEAGKAKVMAAASEEVMFALNPELKVEFMKETQSRISKNLSEVESTVAAIDPWQYLESLNDQFSINSDILIDDLRRKSPLVVVLDEPDQAGWQHAYVLKGAGFSVEEIPAYKLLEKEVKNVFDKLLKKKSSLTFENQLPWKYSLRWVELIDPAIGKSIHLPAKDFRERVHLMMSKERSKEILSKRYDIVKLSKQNR